MAPREEAVVSSRPRRNEPCAHRAKQQLVRAIDDFIERAGAREHRLRLRQQFVPRRDPARVQRGQHVGGLMPGGIERFAQGGQFGRVQRR
jgi:hypothetical protein